MQEPEMRKRDRRRDKWLPPESKFVLDMVKKTIRDHISRRGAKFGGVRGNIPGPVLKKEGMGSHTLGELDAREQEFTNELEEIKRNKNTAVQKCLKRLKKAYKEEDKLRFLMLANFLRSSFVGRYDEDLAGQPHPIKLKDWDSIEPLLTQHNMEKNPLLFIKILSFFKTPNLKFSSASDKIRENLREHIQGLSEKDAREGLEEAESSVLHQLIQAVSNTLDWFRDEKLWKTIREIIDRNLEPGGHPQLASAGLFQISELPGSKALDFLGEQSILERSLNHPSPAVVTTALSVLINSPTKFQSVLNSDLGSKLFKREEKDVLMSLLLGIQKTNATAPADPDLWKNCLLNRDSKVFVTAMHTIRKLPEEDYLPLLKVPDRLLENNIDSCAPILEGFCKSALYAGQELEARKFARAFLNLFKAPDGKFDSARIRRFSEQAFGAARILNLEFRGKKSVDILPPEVNVDLFKLHSSRINKMEKRVF